MPVLSHTYSALADGDTSSSPTSIGHSGSSPHPIIQSPSSSSESRSSTGSRRMQRLSSIFGKSFHQKSGSYTASDSPVPVCQPALSPLQIPTAYSVHSTGSSRSRPSNVTYDSRIHQKEYFRQSRDGKRVFAKSKGPWSLPCDATEQLVRFHLTRVQASQSSPQI